MATSAPCITRTPRLLALMKQSDDAINTRDFAAMDAVHRPDMIAHVAGSAAPIYGRAAHGQREEGVDHADANRRRTPAATAV